MSTNAEERRVQLEHRRIIEMHLRYDVQIKPNDRFKVTYFNAHSQRDPKQVWSHTWQAANRHFNLIETGVWHGEYLRTPYLITLVQHIERIVGENNV